jgi:glucose/arabinose dehydrogenase
MIRVLSALALTGLALIFLFWAPPQPKYSSPVVVSEKLTFKVDTVVKGLKTPWGMAFLPDGSMLFTERGGDLHLVKNGKLAPKPIAGVPKVHAKGQGGLLDVELHPDYKKNGWIYLTYSAPVDSVSGGSTTTLMRARLKDNTLVDQETLFQGLPAVKAAHHYGSKIVFDNAGYVYFSMGDRGEMANAQLLSNHRGKTFRLHDDGKVPADNPFVNTPGAKPEIFTYGNRNPQGLAKHPVTGEIWETEHGPKGGDELNILHGGKNYGWPTITYGINYDNTIITTDTVKEGMEQPVIFWRPSIGPCGLAFVTSDKYPGWKNNLLAGSMAFTYLERIELDGNKVVHQEKLLDKIGRIRDITQGPDGYVYLAIEGPGMIVRLTPTKKP